MKYSFLFCLLWLPYALWAQSDIDTIHYQKDTFLVQQMTIIPFETNDTPLSDSSLLLAIWVGQDTALATAPIEKKAGKVTGALPGLFLEKDFAIELRLGTAMVKQFVETQDSIVKIETEALALNLTIGSFYLDFRAGDGIWAEFMQLSNYNYWLQQRNNLTDSIKDSKQDSIRAVLMATDINKQITVDQATLSTTTKELATYEDYQEDFAQIRQSSKAVNTGLQKVKAGKKLTNKEMMAIADATGERQKISVALQKKNPSAWKTFQQNQVATERIELNQQQLTAIHQLEEQAQEKLKKFRKQLYTATQKFDYFEGLYQK